MEGLLDRLDAGRILVSDGAMSTMLNKVGLTAGACPEEWNVTHPDEVAAVYRAYVQAGSDIITTNTFGANVLKLERYGFADRVAELNTASIRLAKKEAGDHVLVAASVGCTGQILDPLGDLPQDRAAAAFRQHAEAVAAAGADAILFETFFDLDELRIAVEAASSVVVPIICSMTFDASGRTVMGVTAAAAADALTGMGVKVIGSNCGIGPDGMLPVVQAMVGKGCYVMAQPNAGLPEVQRGETRYDISPETMAAFAAKYVEAGARVVGGCCGSTPEHIAAISRAVKAAV